MWSARYFARRYFAPRYFPKVGANGVLVAYPLTVFFTRAASLVGIAVNRAANVGIQVGRAANMGITVTRDD